MSTSIRFTRFQNILDKKGLLQPCPNSALHSVKTKKPVPKNK
jgi:hypothetical protein